MGRARVHIPKLVRDSLEQDGAYDFGLGVVLRAPTRPGGSGASGSYRVEYRVEPVLPGRPMARRKEAYHRDVGRAFARAEATFEEMQQRAGGTYVEYHVDTPFGEVVEEWLASPHPRWGEQYPDKVRSLLRCWVLAETITVRWRPGTAEQPIAELPIGALTADHYQQALEHVRSVRAYRTYTEVHGLVVQILKWAATNRYLRPVDARVTDQLPLAPRHDTGAARGGTRAVPLEEIPPPERIDALAATAQGLAGRRTAVMIYLLAYTGIRISECLALRNDDRFHSDEVGGWRIHVREQVHKSARRTLPPKWRKHRWAFVPAWLSEDLDGLLTDTAPGALLFPSPGQRRRNAAGAVERVGAGLYPYSNWRSRTWERIVEATPHWPERDDWWPPERGTPPRGKQAERRWQWPVHSLRHACATYFLNVLELDPDDVAKFLGHRSGVQVWEMYVRVRPDLFRRAADASQLAGDPRSRGGT